MINIYMCFKQAGATATLSVIPLKLIDQLTYHHSKLMLSVNIC